MKDLSLEEGNLAKKKPPLVASPFMGILSYYLLCKLIYDHSSCGVSICQIGLVLVFQMRPISCPSDKMSIEVGSSARCGKNWQSRQPRGCRELLLSRPTPKLTQHAPRPSAYQDLYLQHHTHKCLISKSIKPSWGFQSNIKDYIMPVLHPLPRQCSKFTPWTPPQKNSWPIFVHTLSSPPSPCDPHACHVRRVEVYLEGQDTSIPGSTIAHGGTIHRRTTLGTMGFALKISFSWMPKENMGKLPK